MFFYQKVRSLKVVIITIVMFFPMLSCAQNTEINDILLRRSIIDSSIAITCDFSNNITGIGHYISADVYSTSVSTSNSSDYEYFRNNYLITIFNDTSRILLDSLVYDIELYWSDNKEWASKYNPSGDFSTLPVNKGFYHLGNNVYIPFVRTKSDHPGEAQIIFWFENNLYGINLLKSKCMGGLHHFYLDNLAILISGEEFQLREKVKRMDESFEIIEHFKRSRI